MTGYFATDNHIDLKRIGKIWGKTIFYSIIAIAVFVSNYLIVKFDIAQGVTSHGNFYAYNSVTIFLESLFLFGFFVKLSYRG